MKKALMAVLAFTVAGSAFAATMSQISVDKTDRGNLSAAKSASPKEVFELQKVETAKQAHDAMVSERTFGPTSSGPVADAGPYHSDRDILWSQMTVGVNGAIADQDFEAAYDTYDCWGADDFVADADWNIQMVTIIGAYWNGTGPVNTFHVRFYDDAGGAPGTLIDEQTFIATWTEPVANTFEITLPAEVALGAGTYWVTAQGQMDYGVGGQFGWQPAAETAQPGFYWINPGNGFGYGTGWLPGSTVWPAFTDVNLCFQLDGYMGQQNAHDVGITGITAPVSGWDLVANEPVTVNVRNFGTSVESFFDVYYVLDGGAPVTENFAGPINPGETLSYTFTATADLSAYGDHTLDACTDLVGDEGPGNDCTSTTVTNYQHLDCPGGAYVEAELCGEDLNGGCNADPPYPFEYVDCGVTACGFAYADGATRDTDWYEFTTLEPMIISMDLVGEFESQALIITAGSGDCSDDAVIASATAPMLEHAVAVTDCVPAGTFYAWAGPAGFSGVDCGVNDVYYFDLTCEPCTYVDPCEDIPLVDCTTTDLYGSNVGATNYVGNAAGDVFYEFYLDQDATVNIHLCSTNTDYDTYLRVYDDCPDVGTQLYYNDDGPVCDLDTAPYEPSHIENQFMTAGTYYIVVEGYSAEEGNYGMTITCEYGDPCDDWVCTPIDPFAGVVSQTSTNVGAPNVWGGGAGDVGYCFTATADFQLTWESCLPGTDFDTDVYLLEGDPCAGGTEVWYNDGDPECTYAAYASGDVTTCLPAGDYTLIVTGYVSEEGNYEIEISGDYEICVCEDYDCTGLPLEGEGYYPGEDPPVYTDYVNGGCNVDPPVFSYIDCDDEWCGTFFTFYNPETETDTRDMDWYEITFLEDMDVTASGWACTDYNIWIIGTDCTTQYAFVTGFRDITTETVCLQAGTYYVVYAPAGFTGVPDETSYYANVTCVPCEWVSPYTDCQPVSTPEDPWSAGTTEVDPNYNRADRYYADGAITDVQFWGLQLWFDGAGWNVCAEDPVEIIMTFYDMTGDPGAVVYTETFNLSPTPTATFYAGYELMEFNASLTTPVPAGEGYLGIQGSGATDCWLLWMSSSTGADNASVVNDGTGWLADTFDLSYCMTTVVVCDPPENLVITPSGVDMLLSWDPVAGATDYKVMAADVEGYSGYYELGTTGGASSYIDYNAQAAGKRFYKIVAVCE